MTQAVCMSWFTVEIVVRFASCPHKWQFAKVMIMVYAMVIIIISDANGDNCKGCHEHH